MTGRLGLGGLLPELARHPALLWEAVRAWAAMRRHGRLLPSDSYLQWRLHTAYGDDIADVPGTDVVHYLAWRRDMRRLRRWEGRP